MKYKSIHFCAILVLNGWIFNMTWFHLHGPYLFIAYVSPLKFFSNSALFCSKQFLVIKCVSQAENIPGVEREAKEENPEY